jgi:tRNA U34 5-methylaminomethyl-2-thiouridine-forming methyltransferase MnmC
MKPLLLKHSQLQAFGPSRPSKMWLQSFMNLPLMSPIY